MNRMMAFLFAIAAVAHSSAQGEASPSGVKEITPLELSALLGKAQVIDVNEPDNFEFAHVPGAKLAPYDAITSVILPTDHSTTLVFYCWSPECPAASMAARTAASLGYTDVRCMTAGITGWQDAGLPTEP